MYYLIVSVCLEFGGGLIGWCQLRVAHVSGVRTLADAVVSEDLTWAEGFASKMVYSCDCWQEASVLCHMWHSIVILKCPHMAADSPRKSNEAKRGWRKRERKKRKREREMQCF